MDLNGVDLGPFTARTDAHVVPPEPQGCGALPSEVVHDRMLP
jgi:hypothetical protein